MHSNDPEPAPRAMKLTGQQPTRRRAVAVAATAVAGLAASAALASTASASPDAASVSAARNTTTTTTSAEAVTFTAATLNIGRTDIDRLATEITAMAKDRGVSVVGLQEASDRGGLLAELRTRQGMAAWHWCRVDVPGGPAVPILFDTKVWKLETGCGGFLAVDRTYLGPVGVPTTAKAKYVTAFVLQHKASGRNVRVLNTHLIPSARRKNLPPDEKARRVQHVKKHVAALSKRIGSKADHPMPVFLMGDFNGPGSWDLLQPLKDRGMVGWSTEKTHRHGKLDHVVRRSLANVSRSYVASASDHKAVVNTMRF